MSEYDLRFSRRDRLAFYLREIVDRTTANKIYEALDWLPDKALIELDTAIYEDLQYEGYIPKRSD